MKDHSPKRRTVVSPTTFGFKEKANSDVTTRQMTPEEWARTDLFKPSDKQFKVLNLHFEGGHPKKKKER